MRPRGSSVTWASSRARARARTSERRLPPSARSHSVGDARGESPRCVRCRSRQRLRRTDSASDIARNSLIRATYARIVRQLRRGLGPSRAKARRRRASTLETSLLDRMAPPQGAPAVPPGDPARRGAAAPPNAAVPSGRQGPVRPRGLRRGVAPHRARPSGAPPSTSLAGPRSCCPSVRVPRAPTRLGFALFANLAPTEGSSRSLLSEPIEALS